MKVSKQVINNGIWFLTFPPHQDTLKMIIQIANTSIIHAWKALVIGYKYFKKKKTVDIF